MTNVLQQGCAQPQAWSGNQTWRILDTRFDRGIHFLNTWAAWKQYSERPRLLHYVALTHAAISVEQLQTSAAAAPQLQALVDELKSQWFGLLPGFHRFTLNEGQVLLTLCVGDISAMLRAQQFVADSVYLNECQQDNSADSDSAWNAWTAKALARCCRRGTALEIATMTSDLQRDLTQCGFVFQVNPTQTLSGEFNPRWEIKNTRNSAPGQATEAGSCAVIGAGLAGASVAAALAKRGWQVQVLDLGDAPAAGASGLPVGLVVPHISADDCTLSRLSRSGVRLMLQQARSLLQEGQDWAASGTRQRQVNDSAELPDIWHPQAAWLKPARLVQAWLTQPGIRFKGNARVTSIRQNASQWELRDEHGQILSCTDRVVFANACGALPLLKTWAACPVQPAPLTSQLPIMHGVRGLLTWALHPGKPDPAFPQVPVNGAGSVIPVVPVDGGCAWFIGSSYQPERQPESPDEKNHAANFGRLQKLLPELGQKLAAQFTNGNVNAWKNTRCVTSDRLPVVGPLYAADQPGLWICAGMGSRGLSFAMLCAELLAAQWSAEPLPIEASLAHSLTALRLRGTAP